MRWNPQAELDEPDSPTVLVRVLPEGAGRAVYWRRGARAFVVLDPSLEGCERAAALGHELIHHERGGLCDDVGMPAAWGAVVAREERAVNREVARRMVPVDELEEFVVGMADLGLSAGPGEVAEQFDVAQWVAEVALELLLDRDRREDRSGVAERAGHPQAV